MTATRMVRAVLATLAAAAAAACADHAPLSAPPHAGASAAPGRLLGLDVSLVSCTPLAAESASAIIGPAGGTITVGPHSLVIPPGALAANTTITAVAPSDSVTVVQFGPQGLTFAQPATLTLSYANCGLLSGLQVAYTDNLLNILQLLPSVDDALSSTVTARIGHFSGYAVAW